MDTTLLHAPVLLGCCLTWCLRGHRGWEGWEALALAAAEDAGPGGAGEAGHCTGVAACTAGAALLLLSAAEVDGIVDDSEDVVVVLVVVDVTVVGAVAAPRRTAARQYCGGTGPGSAVATGNRHSSKLPSMYWLPRSRSCPAFAVASSTAIAGSIVSMGVGGVGIRSTVRCHHSVRCRGLGR